MTSSLRVPSPRQFYIGVDLGKLRDHSALVTIERFSTYAGRDPVYVCDVYRWTNAVRAAERLRIGTSYPRVIAHIRDLVVAAAPLGPVTLTVDATGVGQPVVDSLRLAQLPCRLIPVTITAGEHATRSAKGESVPKRELMVVFADAPRPARAIATSGPRRRRALLDELASMTRNLEAASGHDDLALALALAAWPLRPRPKSATNPTAPGNSTVVPGAS